MPFKVPTDIARLSDTELADLIVEGTAEFDTLLGMDNPSDQDVMEAERISPLLKALNAETQRRESANANRVERMNAVRAAHSEEAEPNEPAPDPEPEPAPPDPPAAAEVYAEDLVQAADESDDAFARRRGRYRNRTSSGYPNQAPVPSGGMSEGSVVVSDGVEVLPAKRSLTEIAQHSKRPERPSSGAGVEIIVSADVPEFATGSRVESLLDVAKMAINRMKGFPKPSGIKGGQMHQYGICSFRTEYPDDLITHNTEDDWGVIMHAADERRLPGGSLTASAPAGGTGWCAPSQVLYALCEAETLDGLVSMPEVQVTRGGIKFTKGPDFSAIYTDAGFCLTEAQVIAGDTKPCYEVPCPPFTEVRLDACGQCVRVPILMNAAYPELVQRVIRGVLVAHQHQMNAKVLNAMATALGPAVTMTDHGGTFIDSIGWLELICDAIRTRYRLGLRTTMEVIAPFWLQGAIQNDLANRMGLDNPWDITDAVIDHAFSQRLMNIQWVYDWQDLTETCPTDYPATAEVMVFPAGTFVKGVSDVINLNAVYDAASLSQNFFTGLFMEQGVLVANTCFTGCLVEVPVCNAGRTGAADVTCGP